MLITLNKSIQYCSTFVEKFVKQSLDVQYYINIDIFDNEGLFVSFLICGDGHWCYSPEMIFANFPQLPDFNYFNSIFDILFYLKDIEHISKVINIEITAKKTLQPASSNHYNEEDAVLIMLEDIQSSLKYLTSLI